MEATGGGGWGKWRLLEVEAREVETAGGEEYEVTHPWEQDMWLVR